LGMPPSFFFTLRNGERIKGKGNMPIGLVVYKPRKCGVRTVGRPQCSISEFSTLVVNY